MKHSAARTQPDEDELEFYSGSSQRVWSMRLIKVVSALLIFMAGAVLGLSMSSQFTRYSQADLFFPTTLYTANCDKEYLNIKDFINPTTLRHSMTDDELFWRATMVSNREEYPFKREPKVAFMFLTRGALPFVPLWEKFFHGHEGLFSVYIHSPPSYRLNVSVTSPFYGRQVPSQVVQWGSVSLLDAEKRLLANALLDFSNERFILLSESCIPIFDFPTVYKYLISSEHSFVEAYDEASPRGRGRYSRHMYPHIKLYQWRKGSEWFELNRKLAVTIVADLKYYNIFKRHCRPSCYPDEHYIPTYLNMFHGPLSANRTITWVDWSRGGPHPALFGREDVTAGFIQSIRNNGTICRHNSVPTSVCFLFARKFASSALEPLLNISSTVMKF